MPELPITDDEVNGAARSRIVLAKIEAVMLWPDDPDTRAAAVARADVQHGLAVLREADGEALVTVDDMVSALAAAANVPGSETIAERAKPGFEMGIAAGWLLSETMGFHGVKMSAIKSSVGEQLGLGKVATMEKVWQRTRPVAHLWAAHISAWLWGGDTTFPCTLARLPAFLADSAAILESAVAQKPKQGKVAVMRRDEAWTVPPGVTLPNVGGRWRRRNC